MSSMTIPVSFIPRLEDYAKQITIACNDGLEPKLDTIEIGGLFNNPSAPENSWLFCGHTNGRTLVRSCPKDGGALIEFRNFQQERDKITEQEQACDTILLELIQEDNQ